MWVAPEARGAGIGRRLLDAVEGWIASCDGRSVQLSVADTALAARRLYETAGYEPDGDAADSPHTPGVTHLSLRKDLPDERRAGGTDPE
jgi:ribosomal protein S18 acetylase RimI-like enzyme